MAPLDLDGMLRRLHLPTVRRLYPELESRTETEGLSHRDFLALLIAEEVAHRAQTRCAIRAILKCSSPCRGITQGVSSGSPPHDGKGDE
jgi:hypothetical protein